MHARCSTLTIAPDRAEDAVAFVRDQVMPAVTGLDDCLGLSMLVDRDEGRCIVTSAWREAACMRASGEHRRFLDEDDKLFVEPPKVEEWEIAVLHRSKNRHRGRWARLAWMVGDVDDVDRQVDVYRMLAVPRLDEIEGFCGASLLLDRRTGRAVSCVTYESRAALDDGRDAALAMRREAVAMTGVEIQRGAEMELALAHLRVPETV